MSGFGVLFNIVINKIIAYYLFLKYWKSVTIYVLLVWTEVVEIKPGQYFVVQVLTCASTYSTLLLLSFVFNIHFALRFPKLDSSIERVFITILRARKLNQVQVVFYLCAVLFCLFLIICDTYFGGRSVRTVDEIK